MTLARRLSSAITVVILTVASLPLNGVCRAPGTRVCGEYFRSDVVFQGTLIRHRHLSFSEVSKDQSVDGNLYTFQVTRVFRGKPNRLVALFNANDSGRLPIHYARGHSYLIFASATTLKGSSLKVLQADGCGNSNEVMHAQPAMTAIEHIQRATESAIRIEIQGESASVRVRATGTQAAAGVTDKNGDVTLRVPPGRYQVTAEVPFKADVFSYDDPLNVNVVAGQCAEIELVEKAQ
jgi:hypothetical protein